MIEATPEYLLNIVDEDTAFKIWKHLEGMRVYFPQNFIKHYHIKEDYNQMMQRKANKINAIRQLNYKYELSTKQIRRIISKEDKEPFG